MASRSRTFAFAGGIFFLLVALASGHTSSTDEETIFRTAIAALEGRLDVPPASDRGLNISLGRDGKTYPYYPPGGFLTLLPWLAPAQVLGARLGPYGLRAWALLLPPLLVAVFAGWWTSRGATRGAVLLLVFATYLLPLARTLHPLVALALLLAVVWIRRDDLSPAGWGAAFGVATLLRFDGWIWLLGIFATRKWRIRDLAFVAAGGAPFALLLAAYNATRFGNPWTTGYSNLSGGFGAGFATPLEIGLRGLLLSPSRSIFIYAPLSVVAGGILWRETPARRDRVALAATWLLPLLWYAKVTVWHGGPGWGPRYLLPGLTLAALGLGVPGILRRDVVRFAASAGLAMNLLAVLAAPDVHFDRVFEGGATIEEAYLDWRNFPPRGQLETLAELRWDRPELPSGSGGWADGGAGHPWVLNLRQSLDLWPVYAWKTGRSGWFALLWVASLAGGILLLASSHYAPPDETHERNPGGDSLRRKGASAPGRDGTDAESPRSDRG